MITVYTGIDLVDTTRLDGLQPGIRNRFIKRVFTPLEIEEAGNSLTSLSGKFAVKEAVAKALGCGIGAIGWQSIEVLTSPSGAPVLKLYNSAELVAEAKSISAWSVSITYESNFAAAVAIGLGETNTLAGRKQE